MRTAALSGPGEQLNAKCGEAISTGETSPSAPPLRRSARGHGSIEFRPSQQRPENTANYNDDGKLPVPKRHVRAGAFAKHLILPELCGLKTHYGETAPLREISVIGESLFQDSPSIAFRSQYPRLPAPNPPFFVDNF